MYNNPFGSARFGGGGSGGQQAAASPGSGTGSGDVSNQIMVTVKQDMEAVDKSGQWVFSCYSPAKDCVCVPGMDDVSPEELRHEAYTARAANTMDQHIAKVKNLTGDFSSKRNSLKNPDPGLRQVLVKIYNKENQESCDAGDGVGEGLDKAAHLTPISEQRTSLFN